MLGDDSDNNTSWQIALAMPWLTIIAVVAGLILDATAPTMATIALLFSGLQIVSMSGLRPKR